MPGRKRIVGGTAALAVLAIPITSFAFDWRLLSGSFAHVGYALVGVGGLIGLLNLYLFFFWPLVLQRSRRAGEAERHVSGVPMLGMLVLPGLYLAPPSVLLSVLVLLVVAGDTGNLAWFVWATWSDDGGLVHFRTATNHPADPLVRRILRVAKLGDITTSSAILDLFRPPAPKTRAC